MKRNTAITAFIFTLCATCWAADAQATKVGGDEESTPHADKKPRRDRPERPTMDDPAGNLPATAPSAHAPNPDSARNRPMLAPQLGANYHLPPAHIAAPGRFDGNPPPNPRLELAPRVGMQWSTDEQKPSLEYRMSDNGVVRLHGSHRGAQVRVQWKF